MKRLLLSFFMSFFVLLSFNSNAQTDTNTVNLKLFVYCSGQAAPEVLSVSIKEGEPYTLPSKTIDEFPNTQLLYNALVGTQFKFEYGSLSKDITVELYLYDVNCSEGLYLAGPDGEPFFFHGNFQVYAKDSNNEDTLATDHFYFDNGLSAELKIKKSADFYKFIDSTGINPSESLEFAYEEAAGIYNTDDIITEETDEYIIAKMRHFSIIAGSAKTELTDVNKENGNIPTNFELKQNYPNPFNPTTNIEYSLPQKSFVQLNVYNILGMKVAELVNAQQGAGSYHVSFDASKLSSGLYIYEIRTNRFIQSRKMMLLK